MKKQLLILMMVMGWGQMEMMWALDAPVLTSPSNNYQNAFTRVVLSGTNGEKDGYHIQVDTTMRFNSPLFREQTWSKLVSTFSCTMTDLHFNAHYYWRVRSVSATDSEVYSDWSEIRDFYTNHPVTIVGPNDASKTETYYPQQNLQWKTHPGCGTYTIEIDTVATFNSSAKVRQTWSGTASTKEETTSHTVQDLYLGKMIYWRVKYYNTKDSSDWSETGQFHTLSKAKGESPKDLTDALTTQTFKWEYKKGLTNVIIELDTTDRFNSPAKRTVQSSGSSQSYSYTTISEMFFGKDYYWRVKAYHQKDTTDWSDVLHFKTYNHCNLSSPADGNTGNYTKVNLYYSYVSDISKYQVQLDTTPRFNSSQLQTRMSSTSSSSYAYETYSELLFGQDYYWRVRRCHSKDTSNWSETRRFSTYSYCPLTATPTDSATGVSTSPYLYFNACYGISKYQQQIDTTPLFNSPVMESKIVSGSEGSDYNYTYHEDLYFGKTYYRRTRRCHSKDTSDWSVTRCFTTIERGAYSTTSGSLSIAKGATGIAINPKLYYYYRSYIDSVEIQIDTTEQFNSSLFQSIRVKEAGSQTYAYEYPKNQLLYGTTYYWRIRNSHSKDVSDWTFPRYFTTVGLSPAPTLVGPEDKSVIFCDDATEFSWKAYTNATAYTLQLSDKSSFDSIWNQVNASDTTVNVQLKKDVTYYWRVQAVTAEGRSKWSNVWMLSTKDSSSLYTLETPVLTWPDSVITNAYTRQQFKWNAVEGAGKYVLQIDTSKTFATPTVNDTLTERDVMRYHFRYGTTHYWRVRALSATSAMELSRWSQVRRFTTIKAPTISTPNDSNPEEYYNPKQKFIWNNSCGSTKYVLEIDTCPGFDSPAKKRVTESTYASNDDKTLSTEVGHLYLGKMNYWRVKAYNNNDSSEWSKAGQFHTLNWAACSSPADSAKNQYTTRYLYWKRIEGLPHVIIELDTTAGFDSKSKRTITSWAYNDDDAKAQVTQLLFGTTYYWRVRYHHNCDTTVWSPTRCFSTYKHCTLSSPADSVKNRLTTGYVYWEWSTGVSHYQVQIDTSSRFDKPVVNTIVWDPENGDHGYQFKELDFGTTYFWRVRECHAKDTSNWSTFRRFTTYDWGNHGSSPADEATNVSVTPKLYIEHTKYISTYYVQIDTALTFDSPIVREQKVESTVDYPYWQVTDTLLYGTTYYWRVRDAHTKDTSNWSGARVFTTTYQMAKPILTEPANQTTIINDQLVIFVWNTCEDASKYIFQLSDDGQFRTWLHQEILTDTTTSLVPPKNSILYWRVQAINSKGRSPWSNVRGIGTVAPQPTSINDNHNHNDNHNQIKKILINGQLYIIKDDKRYDTTGFTRD